MNADFTSVRSPVDGCAVDLRRDRGVVQDVDAVAREVRVLLPAGMAVVDMSQGCPIVLRGERVKLRMLQPGDRVRVTYTPRRGLLVGQLLEVHSEDDCRSAAREDRAPM